jgi:hypothetical protein
VVLRSDIGREGGGGCVGRGGGVALVDHCTNNPPCEQWLARLDIDAVSFVGAMLAVAL